MAEATAASAPRAREYETIYVLRPDLAREAQERVAARIDEVVGKQGGQLTLVENWGRRGLAYPVARYKRGVYVYLKYIGGGAVVSEIERNLRMLDEVLKYQTVKVREGLDPSEIQVDPENVKFEAVEIAADEEEEESRERELGLDDSHERELAAAARERDSGDEEAPEEGEEIEESEE
jgi:small subunit ribosomal protein S6